MTVAAVTREVRVNALVNMSQTIVSPEHHPEPSAAAARLSEQALAWPGLPVVTIRPMMFLESFSPSPVRPSAIDAAWNCRSGGATPRRPPRLMSLG